MPRTQQEILSLMIGQSAITLAGCQAQAEALQEENEKLKAKITELEKSTEVVSAGSERGRVRR